MLSVSKTCERKIRSRRVARTTVRCLAAAMVGLMASASALAGEGEVEATLTAYAITIEEDGAEQMSPAVEIKPGGIIEYDIDYRNATDDPLENFIVLGDVPDQTTYLSVTSVEGFQSEMEVHVPGLGWSLEPVIRYVQDETGALVATEVQPEEYDALRWRMPNALAPGEEISVSYRIRVNN